MKRRSYFLKNDGFTVVDIIVASLVIGLVFVSSIATLTYGYKLLETARFNTLASKVIQSEIETLRLKNWAHLAALPASEKVTISSEMATAAFNKFTCARNISSSRGKAKRIIVVVQWTSSSGRVYSRRYTTCMMKDGLNDYYYTKR